MQGGNESLFCWLCSDAWWVDVSCVLANVRAVLVLLVGLRALQCSGFGAYYLCSSSLTHPLISLNQASWFGIYIYIAILGCSKGVNNSALHGIPSS
jgi:hypothetical protein